jgi:hypothetical protein
MSSDADCIIVNSITDGTGDVLENKIDSEVLKPEIKEI